MIIDAEEGRLFVISDLHLGNPSSTARSRLVEFLEYARLTGTSVCVNGDGFEMLQTSFSRLSSDAVPVLNALKRLMRDGNRVYYLVGNHDISLEHFLEDWLFTQIAPFLNLTSGEARIRIEHGHLYDPWFVRYPKSYELGARVLGLAL
ncbi:MAG TPA: metallophosphoesterase, partial [Acidimicrobiales bacterium]|nr:metallophosphoesterase [Acidimicrobiales bacterium]